MRVELQEVRKSHMLASGGFITVLAGADLVLESGTAALLHGAAGSGKTTLLNIIGGLARPTAGSVLLDGTPPGGCCASGGIIARAFQEPVFIPELTVTENLLLPLLRSRENAAVSQGELLLERFGLAEQFDLLPATLSAGEKQRLNLARAVLPNPRLLLLDEPFAGLDEEWQEKSLEIIRQQVRDTRATLVIASTGRIPGCADFRQLRLLKGRVISDGNNDY